MLPTQPVIPAARPGSKSAIQADSLWYVWDTFPPIYVNSEGNFSEKKSKLQYYKKMFFHLFSRHVFQQVQQVFFTSHITKY